MMMHKRFSLFLFFSFFFSFHFSASQIRYEFAHLQMGTQFRMVFYEADSAKAVLLADSCWKRLDELNLIMSDYRSDSEIMQLCLNAKVGAWQSVSEDLFRVVSEAQRASKLTNGLFDITVSPLTKLWRRMGRQKKLPTASQLADARQYVGYQYIELDSTAEKIRFLKSGTRLDLGGIGKGFALDELMKVLRRNNVRAVLLEAGGSILLGDSPPDAKSWEINISGVLHVLSRCGISTSGDRFQFVEIEGKRYAHILDPRTGFGFREPREITVVASNAVIADWASTAAYLMNEAELERFVSLMGIKVLSEQ